MAELSALDRASTLALHATSKNTVHDNSDVGIDQLCNILVPHIPRCRSISILTDKHHGFLPDTLLERFRDMEAPLLEQFFLQTPSYSLVRTDTRQILPLGAPMLSCVHLIQRGITGWHLPFTSLTTLHLQVDLGVKVSHFFAMISQCLLLETLAIYDGFSVDHQQAIHFTLPHLRSLQLYGDIMCVGDILLGISAPVLECLVIAPFHCVDLRPRHSPEGPAPNKFLALTSIMLSPYCEPEHPVEDSLRLASEWFPNLTDVTLFGKAPHVLIEALGNITEGDICFPNMRSLALRNISPRFLGTIALRNLISLRISKDKPLQVLYLDRKSMDETKDMQWLHDKVDVVELDKWSILRESSLLCDAEDAKFYPPQY
jgi:hypothetical protein